jgi:formate hydrogenlyase transcriptional activator
VSQTLQTPIEQSLAARYEALIRVSQAIGAHRDCKGLFRILASELRFVVQFDYIAVVMYDAATHKMCLNLLDGSDPDRVLPKPEIETEEMFAWWVYQHQQPLVIPLLNRETRFPRLVRFLMDHAIQSTCSIPLTTAHGRLGALGFGSMQPSAYSDEEVRLLRIVADVVALAIDNARNFEASRRAREELQREKDRLKQLLDLNKSMVSKLAELKDQLAQEKLYLEDEIRSEMHFEDIIGVSPALGRVLKLAEKVARTDSTVLIYGETGTGKELIARAIHKLSPRQENAFVKLNCAAIPTGLLESELFGHEKGAFTGAISQRIGRFELAHRGTVFLDEIGEIPLELQPKLLRVLQEREFERLGSGHTLRTDSRLIAASNRDLAAMAEKQEFRSDLFYRLNVFPIHMPPLRERKADIPLLVRHFADHFARRMKKPVETIHSETMKVLTQYHWPGNVRELQNVVERAVILSTGPVLKVPLSDLKTSSKPNDPANGGTLEEAQRKHILAALDETNWVLGGTNGAAARLGMKRSTLQFRMRRLGISRPARV